MSLEYFPLLCIIAHPRAGCLRKSRLNPIPITVNIAMYFTGGCWSLWDINMNWIVHKQITLAALGQETNAESDTLVVLWTSGDIEVAEKIVYMYVYAAKKAKWFDEVVFIIWGPSAKLLSENVKLQEELKKMQEIGIRTEACVACARMYGVDYDFREMGIDVKGMGETLSDYIKNRYHILTF